jgi:dTDP-4-dehydrorhamnose 3,5-epimerase
MRESVVQVDRTPLDGVVILTPARYGDNRGWFTESWNAQRLAEAGLGYDFVQDNHSYSEQAGTVRGLHYQAPPHAQAKLVRCIRGAIFDVAVDVRPGSPTYGRWAGAELSAGNGAQLLIPAGFLHGFVTLCPDCEVMYKCDGYYDRASEGAVRWDSCGIDWPWTGPVHLKDSDRDAPALAEFTSPFPSVEARG